MKLNYVNIASILGNSDISQRLYNFLHSYETFTLTIRKTRRKGQNNILSVFNYQCPGKQRYNDEINKKQTVKKCGRKCIPKSIFLTAGLSCNVKEAGWLCHK
jgi:hypothetical protein